MGGELSQRLAASCVAREVFAVNLFDCSLSIMNLCATAGRWGMRPVWSKNRWIYVGRVTGCGWAWQGGASFRIIPPASRFQLPRNAGEHASLVFPNLRCGEVTVLRGSPWHHHGRELANETQRVSGYLRTQEGCHKENKSTRSSPWMREKSRGNETNTVLYAQQHPALTPPGNATNIVDIQVHASGDSAVLPGTPVAQTTLSSTCTYTMPSTGA